MPKVSWCCRMRVISLQSKTKTYAGLTIHTQRSLDLLVGSVLSGFVNEVKAKGFPPDTLDAVSVAAVDGIPDDRNLLHQLEHGLRTFSDVKDFGSRNMQGASTIRVRERTNPEYH
ncbi:hypothetical protein V7S43_011768 [Phytophthora oleae]|uniref:Uncharacterized protein n=1 Tax=Phytophthora oleae TaxID=2107226 RepID=A0ABD3F953_9STRA